MVQKAIEVALVQDKSCEHTAMSSLPRLCSLP